VSSVETCLDCRHAPRPEFFGHTPGNCENDQGNEYAGTWLSGDNNRAQEKKDERRRDGREKCHYAEGECPDAFCDPHGFDVVHPTDDTLKRSSLSGRLAIPFHLERPDAPAMPTPSRAFSH